MGKPHRIQIRADFYIGSALAVLLIPHNWLLGWLGAVAVHELGHIIAMRLVKCEIISMEISIFGVVINTPPLAPREDILIAAAGPIAGMSLLSVGRWIPILSICAACQTMYNVIPVYPSDGGRIFRVMLRRIAPERISKNITSILGSIFLCGITAMVFLGIVMRGWSFWTVLFPTFYLLKRNIRKIPCKRS